ncbi:MAG: hypothetical protein ACYSOW_11510 [Planctomycetota bacterium]|jgi:hypothetical protein
MNNNNNNLKTRRQWFSSGLRWGVAGLMAAVSARLLNRDKTADQSCADPKGHTGCRGCGVLNGCSLPRALSFKQFLQKKNGKTNS